MPEDDSELYPAAKSAKSNPAMGKCSLFSCLLLGAGIHLCDLEPSAQERPGPVRAGPEEANNPRAGTPLL